MASPEQIRITLERKAQEIALRPSAGQGTATTRVTLKPGLECDIEEGAWKLTAGIGEKRGGNNAGPNPGVLGRGALGSCLAIGYGMWAARLGVPIDALEVEVQADYDSRGELGIADDVSPGYVQVRYRVIVTSPAPEPDVQRVLDIADRYSPYRDVYARAQDVRRETTIIARP
ncbi:MAG TPA: OsmC family protein [Vicinamibacterales bacterium]